MAAAIAAPVPAVRPAPLDRLPGTPGDDPLLRLAAGWLVGHPARTATAYRRDLEAWARWCTPLGIHPLAAERRHVDAWVRHLTTEPQPRTDRPAVAASVAQVVTYSPIASCAGPGSPTSTRPVGLTAGASSASCSPWRRRTLPARPRWCRC
ncbi:protein of unknown function, putative lambda integrase domain [Blastococcus saxobsidens DD2]|uniref:Core-binding (CB) domain-containing protein n=1 Tax=Blastococcus saxobsidens (strain DD2) TaxID=1146883 RepID=H6RU94_BLASD|nr:protein of unknown function, putative lambda integrase domain [Blastococcus saxobsidens DD2]